MGIDTSNINTDTPIGQITLLIAVIVAGIVALRPVIKDLSKGKRRKNYSTMANELESTRSQLEFAIKVQRNNTEWQIVAREIIRLSRMELVDAGVEISENMRNLIKRLEEIEDRDVYSEHIMIREEDE